MLKVLLIDDEPFILQGLSMIIDWNSEGYEIVGMASNAPEALEIIKDKQPELIITDIKMPVMSGIELIEKVKSENLSDAFFVLLSGYSDFEFAKKALQNECVDYMLKPIDKNELLGVLTKVKDKFYTNEAMYQENYKKLDEKTQRMIKSFVSFDINNKDDNNSDRIVDKAKIDSLVRAVEMHQKEDIDTCVRNVYEDFQILDAQMLNMVVNYLLFQLINLASQEDEAINQQEVIQFISKNAFNEIGEEDGCEQLINLMQDYADYLSQLRGNQGFGVLGQVETYLRDNYKDNITLKDLGKKYYINAAYLGQIFKKQYGESFKDFLNRIRIEKAEDLLLHTDLKIYEIAEEIGYKDIDYFINKFIAIKGCTPTKYRKRMGV